MKQQRPRRARHEKERVVRESALRQRGEGDEERHGVGADGDGWRRRRPEQKKEMQLHLFFLYSINYLCTFILLLTDTFAVIRRLALLAASVFDVSNN